MAERTSVHQTGSKAVHAVRLEKIRQFGPPVFAGEFLMYDVESGDDGDDVEEEYDHGDGVIPFGA